MRAPADIPAVPESSTPSSAAGNSPSMSNLTTEPTPVITSDTQLITHLLHLFREQNGRALFVRALEPKQNIQELGLDSAKRMVMVLQAALVEAAQNRWHSLVCSITCTLIFVL